MSGGSFDYICFDLAHVADRIEDKEIKELTRDLANLLHDLEWYESGDYVRDTYERSLKEFKEKWFKGDRNVRLKEYINTILNTARDDINKLI